MRVRFLNNIEIIKEWELLIIMGERKEEVVMPKNIIHGKIEYI